MMTCKNFYP